MTPDELRELCNSGKPPLEFAAAFRDLDEATRKKLSTTAQEVVNSSKAALRKIESKFDNRSRGEEDPELIAQHIVQSNTHRLALLSLFAVGPISQVGKLHRDLRLDNNPDSNTLAAFLQILSDRKPDWADQWVNELLDKEGEDWSFFLKFDKIQDLMRDGVIQRPTSDNYIRMVGFPKRSKFDLKSQVEHLSYELWRLFEVDTRAFVTMPPLKDIDRDCWQSSMEATEGEPKVHHPYTSGGWPRIFFYLSEQEILDRSRLIAATLSAFWRGFPNPMVTGLLRFHDLLAPSDDEIVAHEAAYRELLRNETGTVVALALKALAKFNLTGGLRETMAEQAVNLGVAALRFVGECHQAVAQVTDRKHSECLANRG